MTEPVQEPNLVPCKYCGISRGYTCVNTRDMEDFSIEGYRECFFQLAKLGGGEKGLIYIIANCEAREKEVKAKLRN